LIASLCASEICIKKAQFDQHLGFEPICAHARLKRYVCESDPCPDTRLLRMTFSLEQLQTGWIFTQYLWAWD
jgi:hypothetical protein